MEANMEKYVSSILNTVLKVITNPAGFFRSMPKEGGFQEPLIFAVVLGVISGILSFILSMVGLGGTLLAIILVPIMVAISSFVGAAIMFVIWKIMGSQESYETAYRCGAYACAIVPLTTLVGIIPYLGSIIGIVWMFYLLMVASTEVHKIEQRKAFMVFGVICILMVLMSTCSQFAGRKLQKQMKGLEGRMENMTPEEAGKAFGEFMKGLEEGTDKKQPADN